MYELWIFLNLNNYVSTKESINLYHGDHNNQLYGGTCAELKKINNRSECCSTRDDNCFIINFDSKCYCDNYCDYDPANNDCCSDVIKSCRIDTTESLLPESKPSGI